MKNRLFKVKKCSFLEGTVIATIAIVIVKILGMLYVIPFYAMIGVKGSALYAYAYNIYVIFLDISSSGLPIAISKLISEYDALHLEEAKVRVYYLGKKIMGFIAIFIFILLILFATLFAKLLIGDLTGGNTIKDVTFVIRCVSFAILVVPFLSVSKGFLNGYKVVNVSSISQIIEQVVRILVILVGTYLVLNIFNGSVTLAVGISVFGAFIGGLCAYLYVLKKINDNKNILGLNENLVKDNISNSEIIKKIFKYSIPFVIINIISSCYNFINMIFLLRIMENMGYETITIEFVTGAISTWAPKINMIITSIAIGMTVSLIPNIVSSYAISKWDEVENKFNQALQIILFISIPCTIGISMLSTGIWSVFYGYSDIGSTILQVNIFTALFLNLFMITSSTLQGLNKFKLVYIITIVGFLINIVLDVPLMFLYNKIGIPSYLGICSANMIGYFISVIIALCSLKKEHNISYKKTYWLLKKMIIPTFLMILVVLLCKYFIPVNYESRFSSLIYIGLCSLGGGLIYLFVSYKIGIIKDIMGEKAIKKLTIFGKYRD